MTAPASNLARTKLGRRPRPFAVLFDLDGTLIDSIGLILSSARHAFRDRPDAAPSDDEWLSGVGIPLATMLRRYAIDDADLARLIAAYREHQHAHHDRMIRCYDTVVETVQWLHRDGHPMAIVTSKGDALAKRGLEHVGIAQYMATIVGCDSTKRHKPDPEPVRVALDRLGYAPHEAIFVGDSVHDIAAGNAAGVATVAALWGPFRREQLAPSHPRHMLEDISRLPALLRAIGGAYGP
jgi:pyrophosphatase PpaX